MPTLAVGQIEEFGCDVAEHHLASNLEGSEGGTLFPAVYSTGALVGLMEACCARMLARTLLPGEISAGAGLEEVTHSAPTGVGSHVRAVATYRGLEGKFHSWDVTAFDAHGPIGTCRHRRVVLDSARFHRRALERSGRRG